jgi:dienelactone hydrolase
MAVFASSITVKQETIDDAAAAVDALASHERINKGQIFVLGHSLGGTLKPRIAKANDKIAGFICLAGSVRPLDVLLIEQTKYILSLDGPMTEEKRKQIEQLEQQIAKIRLPDLSLQTAAKELPLGVPASYWLDLRGYDPAEAAKEIAKPILILQGERDYQVTMEDFGLWKAALGSSLRVRFISYSTLNHLFVEGKGKSSPAEYSAPGNVAEVVVRDIATWINSQSQQ